MGNEIQGEGRRVWTGTSGNMSLNGGIFINANIGVLSGRLLSLEGVIKVFIFLTDKSST